MLFSALVNVSVGRIPLLVDRIGASIASSSPLLRGPALINVFRDEGYNRTVYTLVGEHRPIVQGVLQLCETALRLVDLREHEGVHPRAGVIDLVPIHPLGHGSSLTQAADIAREVGTGLERLGVAVVLYGEADEWKRSLRTRRRELRWFSSTTSSEKGWTAVGATPYVLNCNVEVDTTDVDVGRRIAAKVRDVGCVEVMAFPHKDRVEVACNILRLDLMTPHQVVEKIHAAAREENCRALDTVIVGFTEDKLLAKAKEALGLLDI